MRELSLSDINADLVHLRSWIEFSRSADEGFGAKLERVRELLPRIPPIERDVIELHFFKGKHQEQIGEMLGMTQQAVSHRMRRALSRLSFLLEHPDLTLTQVRHDLRAVWTGSPRLMAPLLVAFARTSSQTETARLLQVSQQFVRRQLALACAHFQGVDDARAKYYAEMLARLLANRSILCEPRRSHEFVRAGQVSSGVARRDAARQPSLGAYAGPSAAAPGRLGRRSGDPASRAGSGRQAHAG